MDPEKIYQILRDRTIWLDLRPESILKISDLANEFGVSRTPVKEALIQLRTEGWVFGNGSQYVVTPLSMDRFREITEIRMILEVEANVLAMNRFNAEDFNALGTIDKDLRKFDRSVSTRRMAEADFEFHSVIYKATKNKQLARKLSRLLAQNMRFWLSIPRMIEPDQYYKDVEDITRCIREKDETGMRQATRAHIRWAADGIVAHF
jgi:DNA-binding GntR family transcriptional regulator